jgi:nucleoside-diphosphate-sugar epimerase
MMISVIGGSGFVGTRLCKRLAADGKEFCIIDKAPSQAFGTMAVKADVCDTASLRQAMPMQSVLINLAAEHRDDVRPLSRYDEVNVQGARNICEVAEEKGVTRIVFTSSVACYGFAPADTGEDGAINPFNDYGRTKAEAEVVFREWQARDPGNRSLVIVRPTVIFGEQNRGNVYNLLKQVATGRFVMIGNGRNRKSMAYVENVAAFLEHSLSFGPGVHLFNYVDKPDFDMQMLVSTVREKLGRGKNVGARLPYSIGYLAGLCFDVVARVSGKRFPISAIRVKKFCSTTQFASAAAGSGFMAPVTLQEGLQRTVQYEFLEDHSDDALFYTE